MERECDLLIVNGVRFPTPDYGLDIQTSQSVSQARNSNNAFVGQKVGRRLWKINNLVFSNLSAESVSEMMEAIADFTFPVTFTDYTNTRRTVYMYPSDITVKPYRSEEDGLHYTQHETIKFNLIDCGWD